MSKNLVFIGSLPPPVTGESLVNDLIVQDLKLHYTLNVIDANINDHATSPGTITWKKAALLVRWIVFVLMRLAETRFTSAYIICGQTKMGLLRFSPAILFCKLKCSNVVIHFHGSQASSSLRSSNSLIRLFLKRVFSKTKIVVLSETLKSAHESAFDTEAHVVRNFVPQDNFTEKCARIDEIKKGETIRCLYMSNLLPEKGLWESIAAVRNARDMGSDICLEICGGGSKEILREIDSLEKANPWLKYRGVLSGNQKHLALANSHIFLLPSFYRIEGMPISLLEAARFENLIITTNQGAISDFIEDGVSGYICMKQNTEDLTRKILEIAGSPYDQTKIIDTALAKVKAEYNFEEFAHAIKTLL